jgi:hypothetical protein
VEVEIFEAVDAGDLPVGQEYFEGEERLGARRKSEEG